MKFIDLTLIRHRFRGEHRFLPISHERLEFNYLLAFAITMALILWMLFH